MVLSPLTPLCQFLSNLLDMALQLWTPEHSQSMALTFQRNLPDDQWGFADYMSSWRIVPVYPCQRDVEYGFHSHCGFNSESEIELWDTLELTSWELSAAGNVDTCYTNYPFSTCPMRCRLQHCLSGDKSCCSVMVSPPPFINTLLKNSVVTLTLLEVLMRMLSP